MTRRALCLLTILLALSSALGLLAQDSPPVPTLVVPTLVPAANAEVPTDALPAVSAVADIVAGGIFRVGLLYNDPPYSELNFRGELSGFDPDLLRKIASAWDSEIEFVQVTRLNALDKLNNGDVHAVASALIHYRDLDAAVGFSQTYLRGGQSLMVASNSPLASPAEAVDAALGYVLGTRTEKALNIWQDQIGRELNLRPFLNLDRAVSALTRAEVAAVAAEEQALLRLAVDAADAVKVLAEPVVYESRAIAVKRQDAPMRHLLNRSLQFLANSGEIDVLFREYFPDAAYNGDIITLWSGIGESVTPAQFPASVQYPSSYALPRVASRGVLRVGGATDSSQAATAGQSRLAELNLALVTEIARRWGVSLQLIPSNPEAAAELLDSGAVDLVVGMKPDWNLAAGLDFSAPYLMHGDRLMVRSNSGIAGFNDLRGRFVGILIGDASARQRAEAWADSINATIRVIQTTETGAALTLLDYNNANAIYADSLALLAHLEANPNSLRLTDRWYSRAFYTFALPYNDPDFRQLVDYSLQELIKDGTLYRLTAPLIVSDELPAFDIIPGLSQYAGIDLTDAA